MATSTGDPIFDCDNHYYEALDAFTRHLDKKYGPSIYQWAEINGRKFPVIGGRVNRAVANPTFNPVTPAGALYEYFRGNPERKTPLDYMMVSEPIRPEYRDRDARLARMDEQGLEQIWLFPTLGMLYEEELKHDPKAVSILFTAFNRWLDEDWGLNYRDRIFAGPYISLADVTWACRELEWALDHDARTIVMRAAAPFTAEGFLSPFDPTFDPFWARVNEAGITVVIHAGSTGYSSNGYAEESFSASFREGVWKPTVKSFAIERAAQDFILASIFEKLFDRFPNVRMASVENGSEFLSDVCRKVTSTAKKSPGYFTTDPVESLRAGWWINPFWEDDVHAVAQIMGADHVLFGSDWPHIEALPDPAAYENDLKAFDDVERRRILHDNTAFLNLRRPV